MSEFIVTRGSTLKRNADKDFVAVSYTAPKKKHKSIEVNPKTEILTGINERRVNLTNQSKELRGQDAKREQEKEMKRARFDVIKFGMSGFDGAKGEEAKVNLAIKLGAKPPKNKAKNYKELKLEKEKAKEDAKGKDISILSKTLLKNNSDKKRRRKQPDLLSPYGVVKKKPANVTNNKRRS